MTETKTPAYELHQHTSISDPWEWMKLFSMQQVMAANLKAGLAGGLKTDHNTLAGTEEWLELAAQNNFVTSPAVEIDTATADPQRTPHVIAVLPEWRPSHQKLPYFEPGETALKKLRDLGAFIIAPHPLPPELEKFTLLRSFSFTHAEVTALALRGLIDAVEVTTPLVALAQPLLAVLNQQKVLPVGASDAHMLEQVGTIRTHIPGKHTTVFDALQYGKTHATEVNIESRQSLLTLAQLLPTLSHRWLLKKLAEAQGEMGPKASKAALNHSAQQ